MTRSTITLIGSLLAITKPVVAQVQVSGARDLDFGIVVRGVQTIVAPTDPIRSGRFYLNYVPGGRIQLRMTLPSTLSRVGGGATMSINFKNNDAIIQSTAPGSPALGINPVANTNFTFGSTSDANLRLGGQVLPTATQAAGSYQGTVALTVTVF